MRDSGRINEILGLVGRVWKAYPGLRFNQLIFMLQSEYSEDNGGIGRIEKEDDDGLMEVGFDLFNLEDDKFRNFLRSGLSCGRWGNSG